MDDYPKVEVDLTARIAPAGEHWKVVLGVIDSASGPSLQS